MKEFRALIALDRAFPEKLEHGVNYILVGQTLFKIGATKDPAPRIALQRSIGWSYGFDGEEVEKILVSIPTEDYKSVERNLKYAGLQGLRFAAFGDHAGGRPRECFHIALLPLFIKALEASEAGDVERYDAALEDIELAAAAMTPAREWEVPA